MHADNTINIVTFCAKDMEETDLSDFACRTYLERCVVKKPGWQLHYVG